MDIIREKQNYEKNLDMGERFLSCLIQDKKKIPQARLKIKPSDLLDDRLQKIYAVILKLNGEGRTPDHILLRHEIRKNGEDLIDYILDIHGIGSIHNFDSYVYEILETSKEKRTYQVIDDALNSGESPKELRKRIQNEYMLIDLDNDSLKPKCLLELIAERVDRTAKPVKPISTGFSDLDKILSGGFSKKELVIMGARTSVGKTTLSLNHAIKAAKDGHRTLFFSLEMSRHQILNKIASSVAKIGYDELEKADDEKICEILGHDDISGIGDKILIYDSSLTIGELRAHVAQTINELNEKGQKLDMIIIDYLQLLSIGKKFENRYCEVSEVTRCLKAIAMDFDLPVIALAQLSRKGTDSPELHHLKESGEIEQLADKVILLSRDSSSDEPKAIETITLKIAKNRTGQTGNVKLTFRKSINSFDLIYLLKPDVTVQEKMDDPLKYSHTK